MREHILYETGDEDVPAAILDRNGEVALACCKVCGGFEGYLAPTCPGRNLTLEQLEDIYAGRWAVEIKS